MSTPSPATPESLLQTATSDRTRDTNGSRHNGQSYRMPAEWDRHEATWIVWPHIHSDWPGKFAPIPWVYAEIVRHISQGETVRILVSSKIREEKARRVLGRVGVELKNVQFVRIPTDRGWTRDSGPIFVMAQDEPQAVIAEFGFNAWSKYSNWHRDARVPQRVGKKLRKKVVAVRHAGRTIILEGGSVDVNGAGALITTEECLLDQRVQVRNAGLTRSDYENIFARYLGVSHVVWLDRGIEGDDTHGHVDDLCRFVNSNTVVLCEERNAADPNSQRLAKNRERLEGFRLPTGEKLTVVSLPMPSPLLFDGRRLPASYANFYFSNAAVLVPTFNDPADRQALGILSELIPGRPVIGIHAVDLVWGLGTIHCLTQQQPAERHPY
ncbi:MAG TPA: agmatine deiminase family protein [Bacteroidota bacterium]|nr:agmatine deiminase family protein [Bacteroidota bacterium]